jgi:DNA-3-methyladenine glycosylase II
MDLWDGESFRRVLVLNGVPHLVTVSQYGSPEEPLLNVTVKSRQKEEGLEESIYRDCEKLLGFSHDLSDFFHVSRQNTFIHRMVQRFSGLKPPRFPTIFEGIINGIVCQQISLAAYIQILSRMTEAHGLVDERPLSLYAFPRPEDLSACAPDALRAIGVSGRKSATIIDLAHRIHTGDLDLESISGMTDSDAERFLEQIGGVGPWTAHYVLPRGLGRIHIFPTGDVGVQNTLRRLFSQEPLDETDLERILAPFRAYSGLLYFHLLLQDLSERGIHDAPLRGRPRNRSVTKR